jgi:hypothetical protein
MVTLETLFIVYAIVSTLFFTVIILMLQAEINIIDRKLETVLVELIKLKREVENRE